MNDESEFEKWGYNIIEEVKRERNRFGDGSLEFSIFYSPLKPNPKLMIIGDNPGGQMGQSGRYDIPKIHEYVDPNPKISNYLLANIMRNKIFTGEKLKQILIGSVKTNRIFFRTPGLDAFNSFTKKEEIIAFCKVHLNNIIEKIQPQNILAESFGTFRSLSGTEQILLTKPKSSKALLLSGQYKGIPVYGINHPSRASFHKITNEDWGLVNKELEQLL